MNKTLFSKCKHKPNINYILHPLFILTIVYYAICYSPFFVCSFILALLLHEYAHYRCAKHYGYALSKFSLMPFGARLNLEKSIIHKKAECLISISGPLCNLTCFILCLSMWWLFPESYSYTLPFAESNLMLFLFNILPLLLLDGSRFTLALFSNLNLRKKVFYALKTLNIVFFICLFASFIFSIFCLNEVNFNLLAISLFILLSAFDEHFDSAHYTHALSLYNLNLTKQNAVPVKFFCIRESNNMLISISKIISQNYYSAVIVLDDKNQIVNIIYQSEFEAYFNGGV